MSANGQLGSLVRASVGLTEENAKLVLEYVNLLTGPDRRLWAIQLKERLREKLRDGLPTLRLLDAHILYPKDQSDDWVHFYDDFRRELRVYDDALAKLKDWADQHVPVPGANGKSYELNMEIQASKFASPDYSRGFMWLEVGSYMEHLLRRQLTGRPGILLTNGFANIFPVGADHCGYHFFTLRWNQKLWRLNIKPSDGKLEAGDKLFFLDL